MLHILNKCKVPASTSLHLMVIVLQTVSFFSATSAESVAALDVTLAISTKVNHFNQPLPKELVSSRFVNNVSITYLSILWQLSQAVVRPLFVLWPQFTSVATLSLLTQTRQKRKLFPGFHFVYQHNSITAEKGMRRRIVRVFTATSSILMSDQCSWFDSCATCALQHGGLGNIVFSLLT